MGTPLTMAPEQFDDPNNIDFRADMYGLGCVLYQTITGEPAFSSPNLSTLIADKVSGKIPDPKKKRSDIPLDLRSLIYDLLAPQAKNRPANYAEIIERCDHLLNNIHTPTPSSSKNTGLQLSLAAGIVILLGVVAFMFTAQSAQPENDEPAGIENPVSQENQQPAPLLEPEKQQENQQLAPSDKPAAEEVETDSPNLTTETTTEPQSPVVPPAELPEPTQPVAAIVPVTPVDFSTAQEQLPQGRDQFTYFQQNPSWGPSEDDAGIIGISAPNRPARLSFPMENDAFVFSTSIAPASERATFNAVALEITTANEETFQIRLNNVGVLAVVCTPPSSSNLPSQSGAGSEGAPFNIRIECNYDAWRITCAGSEFTFPAEKLPKPTGVNIVIADDNARQHVYVDSVKIAYPE